MTLESSEPKIAEWLAPFPMDPGATEPAIATFGQDLLVAYRLGPIGLDQAKNKGFDTSKELWGRILFRTVLHLRFGYPNDEGLGSHPLAKHGLKFYTFHVIDNSDLIAEISKYPKRWKHWVATFHDETLDVIAQEATVLDPQEGVSSSAVVTRGV